MYVAFFSTTLEFLGSERFQMSRRTARNASSVNIFLKSVSKLYQRDIMNVEMILDIAINRDPHAKIIEKVFEKKRQNHQKKQIQNQYSLFS